MKLQAVLHRNVCDALFEILFTRKSLNCTVVDVARFGLFFKKMSYFHVFSSVSDEKSENVKLFPPINGRQ